MVTTYYGYLTLMAMSIGGMVFFSEFGTFEDNFECDVTEITGNTYS